jgi:hypothetical protein
VRGKNSLIAPLKLPKCYSAPNKPFMLNFERMENKGNRADSVDSTTWIQCAEIFNHVIYAREQLQLVV